MYKIQSVYALNHNSPNSISMMSYKQKKNKNLIYFTDFDVRALCALRKHQQKSGKMAGEKNVTKSK